MANEELYNQNLYTTIDDDQRFSSNKPGEPKARNYLWSAIKTVLNGLYCRLTGTQTIAGVKTFSSSPQVPNPSGANDAVNYQTLQAIGAPTKAVYSGQTANFTHDLTIDQSLERIDLDCTVGSVTVRIGTTNGNDDVMLDKTISSTDTKNKIIKFGDSWKAAQTLYISISGGGTVNVNIWYLPAIF